jgi:hypothetical protein
MDAHLLRFEQRLSGSVRKSWQDIAVVPCACDWLFAAPSVWAVGQLSDASMIGVWTGCQQHRACRTGEDNQLSVLVVFVVSCCVSACHGVLRGCCISLAYLGVKGFVD